MPSTNASDRLRIHALLGPNWRLAGAGDNPAARHHYETLDGYYTAMVYDGRMLELRRPLSPGQDAPRPGVEVMALLGPFEGVGWRQRLAEALLLNTPLQGAQNARIHTTDPQQAVDLAVCPFCQKALNWFCAPEDDGVGSAHCSDGLMVGREAQWRDIPCLWAGAPVRRASDGSVYIDGSVPTNFLRLTIPDTQ